MLSYLSKSGGIILNYAYSIPTSLSIILFPVFPDLNWFIIASLLVVVFVAGFLPYKPVAVVSNSMSPYFNRGNVCVIKKVNDYKQIRNLKEGDIIEYKLNNIFVIHRIVDIKETSKGYRYSTKGDNNKDIDLLPVEEEQVVGIVTCVILFLLLFNLSQVLIILYINIPPFKIQIIIYRI